MTVLNVFLRNLVVILVVGSLGYAVLSLPFDPLLTAGGYAGLLALLMTWSELSRAGGPHGRARPRHGSTARPKKRQQNEAQGKPSPSADGAAASAPSTVQTGAAATAVKRRTKRVSASPPTGQERPQP